MITLPPTAAAAVHVVDGQVAGSALPPVVLPGVAFRSVLLGVGPPARPGGGKSAGVSVAPFVPPSRAGRAPATCVQARPVRGAHPAAGTGASANDDDDVDPLHRRRAALAPPGSLATALPLLSALPPAAGGPGAAAPNARAASSLEDLIPALVRRIAWSGDRQRGAVRLEIGAGELAGATLTVQAHRGVVRVHMSVPPGADAGEWEQRIADRLAARGVVTEVVEVT
jgi:hypothetical protein